MGLDFYVWDITNHKSKIVESITYNQWNDFFIAIAIAEENGEINKADLEKVELLATGSDRSGPFTKLQMELAASTLLELEDKLKNILHQYPKECLEDMQGYHYSSYSRDDEEDEMDDVEEDEMDEEEQEGYALYQQIYDGLGNYDRDKDGGEFGYNIEDDTIHKYCKEDDCITYYTYDLDSFWFPKTILENIKDCPEDSTFETRMG